jgi:vacuolar-type H+-ATPase subunit I/STV1
MNYYHVITILIGLATLATGFWASFEAKRPWDIVGAVAAPVGLVIALLGTLLLCVPTFFNPAS